MRKGLIIILGSAAMWSACSSAPQPAAEQTATAQQPAQTAAEAPKPDEAKPAAAAAPNAPAQAPTNTTDAPAAETTAAATPTTLPPGKQPMGALSKAEIQGVIRANNKQIRACYEEGLTNNPSLAGVVKARFTIAADGTVAAAKVGESTLDSPEVEDCLIDRIQSWVFPKPRGGVVIVNYPFKFTSQ